MGSRVSCLRDCCCQAFHKAANEHFSVARVPSCECDDAYTSKYIQIYELRKRLPIREQNDFDVNEDC